MQPRIPRHTVIAGIVVAITVVTLFGLFAAPLWDEVFGRTRPGDVVTALVGVTVVLTLYGRLLWLNLMRRITLWHRFALIMIAVVCVLMVTILGKGWLSALMVPAGLFAVVLPIREAVPVTAVATVLTPALALFEGAQGVQVVYMICWIPAASFSGYVQVWFCHVIQELREARTELARSAVGEERRRFARDLHDVLGHSLQAVALRAEVAERFLDRDPGRVRVELAEIQRMARDSVRDVREVVRGYRTTSLAVELDGMSAVLEAAGISCETPTVSPELPAHVHEPLGWVVRESVTNVLRHSSASWCRVVVRADDARSLGGRVTLEITNDGSGRRPGAAGSGHAGLAERIGRAGGAFTAGAAGDGVFRVTAWVPLVPVYELGEDEAAGVAGAGSPDDRNAGYSMGGAVGSALNLAAEGAGE